MSIGFTLKAAVRKREILIQAAKEAAKQHGYRVGVQNEGVCIVLCPMGTLELMWQKEHGLLGQWLISGQCYSTPAGAGFHKAAIELVDQLAQACLKKLTVEDETGYYNHRQFERMRQEHFLPWLSSLVELCRDELGPDKMDNICLCWDLAQYRPENVPGSVVTPMGRFSVKQLAELTERRGIQAVAERFFLWDRAEQGALYHRNCALKKLWEDCYYAPSQRSEEDAQINRDIIRHLERAAQLDPELPLPLAAYREICILDDRDFAIDEDAPELEEEYPIGYRRGEVYQPFDMLFLPLPGSYRYEWENDGKGGGSGLWYGEEEEPVWRASGFRIGTGEAELQEKTFEGLSDVEDLAMKHGLARWGWKAIEEDGAQAEQAVCQVASGPALYLVTVTYGDPALRGEVYRRLRRLDVAGSHESQQRKY